MSFREIKKLIWFMLQGLVREYFQTSQEISAEIQPFKRFDEMPLKDGDTQIQIRLPRMKFTG
jgi:hypothetical protein